MWTYISNVQWYLLIFLFKQKYKLSSTVLRFSCLSYSAHDIPASNKNDNLLNYSIKILRLPSPVAFLFKMTALSRHPFILSLHVLHSLSQWQWKYQNRMRSMKVAFQTANVYRNDLHTGTTWKKFQSQYKRFPLKKAHCIERVPGKPSEGY